MPSLRNFLHREGLCCTISSVVVVVLSLEAVSYTHLDVYKRQSRDCTTRELAEVLGITPRRVESLAAAGWIETSPSSTPRRLRFPLLCAVKQYIDYLRGS